MTPERAQVERLEGQRPARRTVDTFRALAMRAAVLKADQICSTSRESWQHESQLCGGHQIQLERVAQNLLH